MRIRRFVLAAAILVTVVAFASAQETVNEPSTGKSFPTTLTFTADGKSYTVSLTGLAVRKKVVFKVYGIGHYLQDPPRAKEAELYQQIPTDGKAKQITMVFVRDVDVESIQNAYRDSFKENTPKGEVAALAPLIDRFLGYFTKPVKENDVFILRWVPGGTIIPIVQGEEKPAITNPTFAKVLWSIWLGEDSIVDREDLISRIVTE